MPSRHVGVRLFVFEGHYQTVRRRRLWPATPVLAGMRADLNADGPRDLRQEVEETCPRWATAMSGGPPWLWAVG